MPCSGCLSLHACMLWIGLKWMGRRRRKEGLWREEGYGGEEPWSHERGFLIHRATPHGHQLVVYCTSLNPYQLVQPPVIYFVASHYQTLFSESTCVLSFLCGSGLSLKVGFLRGLKMGMELNAKAALVWCSRWFRAFTARV